MGAFCNLQIGRWAFVLPGGDAYGTPLSEEQLPFGMRRRMGRFERLAVRCTLGVLDTIATDELIFCSRYGNLETVASLLRSVSLCEPPSPLAFSGSVHNTAAGLIGQAHKQAINHTAIAAGRNTFGAGLVESYARLAASDCEDVTFAYADVALPEVYREFEDRDYPPCAVALRLSLGSGEGAVMVPGPGGSGILRILDGLRAGRTQIAITKSLWGINDAAI